MSGTRVTRSSVLGKRGFHQQEESPQKAGQLQTPEPTPNPKRPKTTTETIFDGEGNKENIPPFRLEAINADASPTSARATRALRRTATEVVVPTRDRPGQRRRASASSITPTTPTKDVAELAITTPPPTPPTLPQPLHIRVKAALRATCNNADGSVSGRESERDVITKFLTSFLSSDAMQAEGPTSMFISVNSINQSLSKEHADMAVVFVNCMTVKTIDALWDRIIEELRSIHGGPGRSKKEKGIAGVLNLLNSRDNKLILVLDELDHVASNSQSLAALFSLSEKTSSSLRLIGIANTHTLTADSASSTINASNVQTLHFAPYTPVQLQAILRTRLASIYEESEATPCESNDIKKLLPNPSIVLLTKRTANLTGDVRSLFEVLRGAIDLAVAAKNQSATSDLLDGSVASTTPQHILSALKAYAPVASKSTSASSAAPAASSNSEVVNKVRNLGFQARIVLLALLLASKRLEAGLNITTNLLSSPSKKSPASPMKRSNSAPVTSSTATVGIDTQQLYAFYNAILQRGDMGAFDPVSRNDFGDLINVLEGVGLVQLSSSLLATPTPKGKRTFGRAASFGAGLGRNGTGTVGEVKLVEGVWTEEVLRGLGVTESAAASDDLRNEEVKGVWVAECAKITRDVKLLAIAKSNSEKERPVGFSEASED
ncbi:Cdc6B protein [Ephemerocybe angulata]|uniref:Cdc6B protein n=1 Tax=Ephemerocybe angulata TaxID=980116 RepID=A0A8H6MFE0_9AGAR|nr:Cdc6B protein [Tulosesus angulatus]